MLTSKQRADLRAQANDLDTTLMVGKGGVTENVLSEAARQLEARELVKGRRQAREERERRNEYFRQAAIQAAIERRKSREE